jgi:hypothetical protein
MRHRAVCRGLGVALSLATASLVIAGDAGFVMRKEGEWRVGPPPGTAIAVGEVLAAGAHIYPPERCLEEDFIVIAFYHRAAPEQVSCGGPRGRTPIAVEGRPAMSAAARIFRAVQQRFLEHGADYYPTAAKADTDEVLRLRSAVLVADGAQLVAQPSLSIERWNGEVTYTLRRIDQAAGLGPEDTSLTLTVRRGGTSEQLTASRTLEPGLYDVWDGVGLDRRRTGAPARLGTWILVVPPEHTAVQKAFREAADTIKADEHTGTDRMSILRAYLMHLASTPEG